MEHRTSACQKLGANIAEQATGNELAMQEQNLPTGIAKTRWELIENEKPHVNYLENNKCIKTRMQVMKSELPKHLLLTTHNR